MTITQAQLRTLNLLDRKPAHRVYRSKRAGDYTWVHDDADVRLTATLHKLFSSGYAMISPDHENVAVLTAKGCEVLAAQGNNHRRGLTRENRPRSFTNPQYGSVN
jgi:hypothetical protein